MENTKTKKKRRQKVYLVKLESTDTYEHIFNSIPCRTIERAKEILQKERDTVLQERPWCTYGSLDELIASGEYGVTNEPDRFFINDSDGHYEDYYIAETYLED